MSVRIVCGIFLHSKMSIQRDVGSCLTDVCKSILKDRSKVQGDSYWTFQSRNTLSDLNIFAIKSSNSFVFQNSKYILLF